MLSFDTRKLHIILVAAALFLGAPLMAQDTTAVDTAAVDSTFVTGDSSSADTTLASGDSTDADSTVADADSTGGEDSDTLAVGDSAEVDTTIAGGDSTAGDSTVAVDDSTDGDGSYDDDYDDEGDNLAEGGGAAPEPLPPFTTLYAEDARAAAGALVPVRIMVSAAENISGGGFEVSFEPGELRLQEVIPGADVAGFALSGADTAAANSSGELSLSLEPGDSGVSAIPRGQDRELAVLLFRLDADVRGPKLEVEVEDDGLVGASGQEMELRERDGTIKVTDKIYLQSASPSRLLPGQTGVELTVTGANLGQADSVKVTGIDSAAFISGLGVTVTGFEVVSEIVMTVTVDVAADAEPGHRNLKVHSAGSGDGLLNHAVYVAGRPGLTAVVPGSLEQGEQGADLRIKGYYLHPGQQLLISGEGVSITGYQFLGLGLVMATVDVDPDASPGERELTLLDPDFGDIGPLTVTVTGENPDTGDTDDYEPGDSSDADPDSTYAGDDSTAADTTIAEGDSTDADSTVAGADSTGGEDPDTLAVDDSTAADTTIAEGDSTDADSTVAGADSTGGEDPDTLAVDDSTAADTTIAEGDSTDADSTGDDDSIVEGGDDDGQMSEPEEADLDGDGRTNAQDLLAMLRALVDKDAEFDPRMDLDDNGRVDIFDLLELISRLPGNKTGFEKKAGRR